MSVDHIYGNIHINNSTGVVVGDVFGQVAQRPKNVDKSQVLLESLTFDRWDARRRNVSAALHSTCRWLFTHESFQTWLDPHQISQHGGFLWLRGKPGSGKSTLMKEAVTWAKREVSQSLVMAYFFNARSPYELEKSSLGLYRSLVHQLLVACPNRVPLLAEAFSSKERDGKIVEDWTVTELQNFLLELASAEKLPHLIVFIDALDEGEEEDVRDMIDGLVDLTQAASSADNVFGVCLSSRHFPNITVAKSLSIVVEEQNAHGRDIELYVSKKLRGDRDTEPNRIRQLILERAHGVFLWVVLVVTMLNKLRDQGHDNELRIQRLKQIPQDLRTVFTNIISRDPENTQERCILLRWVLFSLRPLTPEELYVGVKTSYALLDGTEELETCLITHDHRILRTETVTKYISNCSWGLVELTLSDYPVVQFIHETVRDFLLGRNHNKTGSTGTVVEDSFIAKFKPDICHASIAEDCLRHLIALASGARASNDDEGQSPLTWYAARYWWIHALTAAEKTNETILNLAKQLFFDESKLLIWLQHYDVDRKRFSDAQSFGQEDLLSPLYYAALIGFTDLVEIILAQGVNVNTEGGLFGTALQAASRSGKDLVVRMILDAGARVNSQVGKNGTALQIASAYGYEIIVQMLLEKGADVNGPGMSGRALYLASNSGHEKIVKMLLDAGAEVDHGQGPSATALQTAAEHGHENIVRLLLENGADINAGYGIVRSLQTCLRHGYMNIVHMLLRRSAEISAQGRRSEALHKAAEAGMENLVDMLLESGTADSTDGGRYKTALWTASEWSRGSIVQILLEKNTYVYGQEDLIAALHVASENGNSAIVGMLLKAKADINAEGGRYGNLLQTACNRGHEEVVRTLVNACVDFNAREVPYSSPIQIAVAGGYGRIVQMLLNAGADINAPDEHGQTPLIRAILDKDKATCLRLVQLKADVSVVDKYGRTAIDWLRMLGTDNELLRSSLQASKSLAETETQLLPSYVASLALLLLENETQYSVFWFNKLGHYFVMLNDLERASFAFQLNVRRSNQIGATFHRAYCDGCKMEPITGSRFVCKVCPDVDLCTYCMDGYKNSNNIPGCNEHHFVEFPSDSVAVVSEDVTKKWLQDIYKDYWDELSW